jgi:hypothetical protein
MISRAHELLNKACEENRHRDAEIMQGVDGEKEHAKIVLFWVEKLTENPSMALKIAGLFHDIDRVVTPGVGGGFKGDRGSKEYQGHKKDHAKRSANYICPKLMQNGFDQRLIERVRFLILHHDDIGSEIEALNDNDLSVLVAADSMAFFTSIAPRLYKAEGEERLKDKIRFVIEKMPNFARELLSSQRLENNIFERLKNEVLAEVKNR